MIFDAGARIHGMEVCPDYPRLLQYIDDYADIDFIFLSHAHYDHIGSYHILGSLAKNAEVFATKATKEFTKLQLMDFGRMVAPEEKEVIKRAKYRQAEAAINKIRVLPVMMPIHREKCTITFYPAGHMAGGGDGGSQDKKPCDFLLRGFQRPDDVWDQSDASGRDETGYFSDECDERLPGKKENKK